MAFFPNEWETFHFLRYAVSYPEMAYVWQIQKSDRRSALTETTSRHKPSKHIPSCHLHGHAHRDKDIGDAQRVVHQHVLVRVDSDGVS